MWPHLFHHLHFLALGCCSRIARHCGIHLTAAMSLIPRVGLLSKEEASGATVDCILASKLQSDKNGQQMIFFL